MAASPPKRALLIAGPTASGKSALALAEARRRGGIVINADALQVYADLRILSARPTAEDEAMVPHRLYGHVPGSEAYSVARWLADARQAIEAAWSAGALPIVVGGTGLYFKALEHGLAAVPDIDPQIRAQWRNFAGDLHGELRKRDPEAAARLSANDRQRLARAIEVVEGTGESLTHWQRIAQSEAVLRGVGLERRLVDVPRAELYQRAEQRFDAMIAAGALAEAEALLDFDPSLPVMKAIGVAELHDYLRGRSSLPDATERAKTATRNYIKRQLTWLRGQGTRTWPATVGPGDAPAKF